MHASTVTPLLNATSFDDSDDLWRSIVRTVPQFTSVVDDLGPHWLELSSYCTVFALYDFATRCFDAGRADVLRAILECVECGLGSSDGGVVDAFSLEFIEPLGLDAASDHSAAFKALLGPRGLADLESKRRSA